MLPLLLAVAGAFATARVTRLLTADRLTLPLRRRVLQSVREGGLAEYLISCAWCTSMHVGLLVAAIVVGLAPALHPTPVTGAATVLLLALGYSHVAGLLAAREVEV